MSQEDLKALVQKFSLTNDLFDYIRCCRAKLTDCLGDAALARLPVKTLIAETPKPNGAHPWEFTYKREKHSEPYWTQSLQNVKDALSPDARNLAPIPSPQDKSASSLSKSQQAQLLRQYTPAVLKVCAKCNKLFLPFWKELRNEFKRSQVSSARGSILTTNFMAIVNHYGLDLSKNELALIAHAFRPPGMADIVQYDEFLRICFLMKTVGGATASAATVNDA
jgi:hypothetical protein